MDGWNTRRTPPLGYCPRDVINLKTPPLLDIHKHPPLDIARVTSSTYSKGGTKLLKGGTKLLKGGTKLLKGGTKLLKGGTKLLKGGTKSLGWATGGGVVRPPRPPPPLATGLVTIFTLGQMYSLCCYRDEDTIKKLSYYTYTEIARFKIFIYRPRNLYFHLYYYPK